MARKARPVFRVRGALALAALLLAAPGGSASAPAAWYVPSPAAWALQRIDLDAFRKPVQAIRVTVASGQSCPATLDAAVLFGAALPDRAALRLRRDARGGEVLWEGECVPARQRSVALPPLPAGCYDLDVAARDGQGTVVSWSRYLLDVWESPVAGTAGTAASARPGLLARAAGAGVAVSGFGNAGAGKGAVLRVTARVLATGEAVETLERPLDGLPEPWTVPLRALEPGRALVVEAAVSDAGRTVARDEIWAGIPGERPAAPSWPAGPRARFGGPEGGESVSTVGLFRDEEAGLRAMLAGMKARGSGVVQLGVAWDQVEPVAGVYDWTNLDAYVACLTEAGVPFVLAHIGSALCNRAPAEACGEWMADDRGRTDLWRKTEVLSPVSPAYLAAAAEFTRRVVLRYRGDPWLAGYEFINQGEDSGIFLDEWKRVTDYSPWARADFRTFLKGRYADVGALNAAWGAAFPAWDDVQPPLPRWDAEADLSVAWRDWTDWKLDACRRCTVGLFDPIVRELDPERARLHYAAYIGPFETLLPAVADPARWWLLDGGGEDPRMGRLNALCRPWGVQRQTESHEVPPANRNYLLDLLGQSLRNGADRLRYNLVWNSLPSLNLANYPRNAALQDALAAWRNAARVRRLLDGSLADDGGLAIVLSWGDLLDRQKIFRWFALPGDRADALARASGHASAAWLSDWSPDAAWSLPRVVLVPEDARVWSPPLERRLKEFVERGGHLVLWGRAGQFTPGDAVPFAWISRWGAPAPGPFPFRNAPAAAVARRGADGKPLALSWPQGKGTVWWCLSDAADSSEAAVAERLAAEVPAPVVCSDPRVEGFLLRKEARTFLVLDWFQGYGGKAADAPAAVRVRLAVPAGRLVPLLPPGVPAQEGGSDILPSDDRQFAVRMGPSDLGIYEILPPAAP